MSRIKTTGLVIKQNIFSEVNRIIYIFTREHGIIKAVVYGAKSVKNRKSSATQFLSYSEFILQKTEKDLMTVVDAETIESFFSVQEDIVKLSLCVYMADLSYSLLNLNSPDEELRTLLLNCVYALAKLDIEPDKVKTVFELRAMTAGGYMPALGECVLCGDVKNISGFSCRLGGIVCKGCSNKNDIEINSDVYRAMSYIVSVQQKKIFAFTADEKVWSILSLISEKYVLSHSQNNFSSLDYYKNIKKQIEN